MTSHFFRALQFLGYLYLLRVPILIWTMLIALWIGSFPTSGAEPILRGIFDVASQSSVFGAFLQFASVTVAALLCGTSMGVSARLVVCNAHIRFRAAEVELSPGLELIFRLIPLVSVALIVGQALNRSEAPWSGKLPGIILGAWCWYVLTVTARHFINSLHSRTVSKFQAGSWLPSREPGYLDIERGTIQPRQLYATYQLLLALLAYGAYFIFSFFDLELLGGHFLVPTLSLLLVMLTLACWGLAGIAFFLDRYRVPLLLPLAAFAFSGGFFPQSDYFYQGLPHSTRPAPSLTAVDVINAHENGPDKNIPIVLVATTGGGIQAAAWTARVLTGLNQQLPHFSHSVRLISSVSGGSVGAMFFSAAYNSTGEVPIDSHQRIIASADQSSLDEVTWGLAYPDLVFGLFPWIKGLGAADGELRTSDGGLIFTDRGRMLEASWRMRMSNGQNEATLSDWRDQAANGLRPAVIFNSTLVETGDRYLLSTATFIAPPAKAKARQELHQGRREFFELYPHSDLRIRTAARLSATFPYVTPAARMLRNDPSKYQDGRFYRPEPHAVDGGYYDNYGMASLLDWLDNGLQTIAARPKIMIVEIRAASTTQGPRPRSASYGSLFQLANPLLTMENVRGTGQLSRDGLDESLVNRLYSPNICEVAFEFNNTDARGCPRNEPLNWHLTPTDRHALDAAWQNSDSIRQNIARVQKFLSEGVCPQ